MRVCRRIRIGGDDDDENNTDDKSSPQRSLQLNVDGKVRNITNVSRDLTPRTLMQEQGLLNMKRTLVYNSRELTLDDPIAVQIQPWIARVWVDVVNRPPDPCANAVPPSSRIRFFRLADMTASRFTVNDPPHTIIRFVDEKTATTYRELWTTQSARSPQAVPEPLPVSRLESTACEPLFVRLAVVLGRSLLDVGQEQYARLDIPVSGARIDVTPILLHGEQLAKLYNLMSLLMAASMRAHFVPSIELLNTICAQGNELMCLPSIAEPRPTQPRSWPNHSAASATVKTSCTVQFPELYDWLLLESALLACPTFVTQTGRDLQLFRGFTDLQSVSEAMQITVTCPEFAVRVRKAQSAVATSILQPLCTFAPTLRPSGLPTCIPNILDMMKTTRAAERSRNVLARAELPGMIAFVFVDRGRYAVLTYDLDPVSIVKWVYHDPLRIIQPPSGDARADPDVLVSDPQSNFTLILAEAQDAPNLRIARRELRDEFWPFQDANTRGARRLLPQEVGTFVLSPNSSSILESVREAGFDHVHTLDWALGIAAYTLYKQAAETITLAIHVDVGFTDLVLCAPEAATAGIYVLWHTRIPVGYSKLPLENDKVDASLSLELHSYVHALDTYAPAMKQFRPTAIRVIVVWTDDAFATAVHKDAKLAPKLWPVAGRKFTDNPETQALRYRSALAAPMIGWVAILYDMENNNSGPWCIR